jgi:hypothetical protein
MKLEVDSLMKAESSGLLMMEVRSNGHGSVQRLLGQRDDGVEQRHSSGGTKDAYSHSMCSMTMMKSSEQPANPKGDPDLRREAATTNASRRNNHRRGITCIA